MYFLEALEEGWGFLTPLIKQLQQEVCTQRSKADAPDGFCDKVSLVLTKCPRICDILSVQKMELDSDVC